MVLEEGGWCWRKRDGGELETASAVGGGGGGEGELMLQNAQEREGSEGMQNILFSFVFKSWLIYRSL